MNQAVRHYVASVIERHPQTGKDILEFGSYDVNGTVRDLFQSANSYLGIDKRPGPNVDLMADVHDLRDAPAVDTVLCLEMLEHDSWPLITLRRACRFLREDGLLIVTTRGIGYGLHDEPEDYWRFTRHGLYLLMRQAEFTVMESIDHTESKGVFGYGRKANV